MLKYLYLNKKKDHFYIITKQKIITILYNNKFFIRTFTIDNKNIFILDNNNNFFLLHKENIKKYLKITKIKNILGNKIQLKEYLYQKLNIFKFFFFNKHKSHYNNSYLKNKYYFQKLNILNNYPLIIFKRGCIYYVINGIRGLFKRKYFKKLKKSLKLFPKFIKRKLKILLFFKFYKKLIIKNLLFRNLKFIKIKKKFNKKKFNKKKNLITTKTLKTTF